jgi:succinoglycan biosynthesis transport protein ExoP
MEGDWMGTERTNRSLDQVLAVLRRRGILVFLCALLSVGAAYFYSKQQTKQYTATVSLAFSNNQPGQQVANLQTPGSSETPQTRQNTNVKEVELGDMAEITARKLRLTRQTVKEDVAVSGPAESKIVEVSATATSPTAAAKIVNTYTTVFVEEQNRNHNEYAPALRTIRRKLASLPRRERAGPVGRALREVAQRLELAELPAGSVRALAPATPPTSPSSPKVVRNTILGAVLGLLLGLGIALLLERFDRRIREPKDLERIYGLPLLGEVPESKELDRSPKSLRKRARSPVLPPSEAEVFQLMRAHLRYFNVDREIRTLLVASADSGDGKTTIALNLAASAARAGSLVLLFEADLREPSLAAQLNKAPGPGLSDVLIGSVSLWNATQTIDLSGVPSQKAALDVLVSGAPPPNPTELIESQAMEATLEQASSTYDFVVIDTPPLRAVSDAVPLLTKVDGVILVGRVGRNRRDVAERVQQTLAATGAPLLGVIANGVDARHEREGYGYGYGYPQDGRQRDATGEGSSNGASGSRNGPQRQGVGSA